MARRVFYARAVRSRAPCCLVVAWAWQAVVLAALQALQKSPQPVLSRFLGAPNSLVALRGALDAAGEAGTDVTLLVLQVTPRARALP